MPNLLEFQAAIFDQNLPDSNPSDLNGLTPGAGGFTPGSRDLLKNIVGHLVANCGWKLRVVSGSDPSTYIISTNGPNGDAGHTTHPDTCYAELSWDVNRANLQLRMAKGLNGATLDSTASTFQAWPVTNGGSAAVNNTRLINVYVYGDKSSISIVTIDDPALSNYRTHFSFGLLKRWNATEPTAAGQAGKDYNAIYYTIPTRMVHAGGNRVTASGIQTESRDSLNGYHGPTASGYGSWQAPGACISTFNAIKVYQRYDDATASWVINHLIGGIAVDSNGSGWSGDNDGTQFLTNQRQPTLWEPTLGTDGLFHMTRERVYQAVSPDNVADARIRGVLTSFMYVGPNAGNDFSEVVAGTETYKKINLNLGFWPRLNPNGFAIRKA